MRQNGFWQYNIKIMKLCTKLSLIDFLLISRPYLHFAMTPKLQLVAINYRNIGVRFLNFKWAQDKTWFNLPNILKIHCFLLSQNKKYYI